MGVDYVIDGEGSRIYSCGCAWLYSATEDAGGRRFVHCERHDRARQRAGRVAIEHDEQCRCDRCSSGEGS